MANESFSTIKFSNEILFFFFHNCHGSILRIQLIKMVSIMSSYKSDIIQGLNANFHIHSYGKKY